MRFLVLLLCGCPVDVLAPSSEDPEAEIGDYVALPPADQLVRVSMALRGMRPSEVELDAVLADPGRLGELARGYSQEPAFRETIKDLYAELLLVRTDSGEFTLPPTGPLTGRTAGEIQNALSEEPLELIAEVVRQGLPFSEIVTADWTMANEISATLWRDLGPTGAEWEQSGYTDGRPGAGILSTSGLWQRHRSQGINANRARANLIAGVLLCEDFLGRDVPISGALDFSDASAVADAVDLQPECVSCHQSLDPIGSYLSGFQNIYVFANLLRGESNDCQPPFDKFCYPLEGYKPSDELVWHEEGLRPPSFYGEDVGSSLADLGAAIAADPRFSQCAATRLYSYLSQTPLEQVPVSERARLQLSFIDSGLDVQQLAVDIVTSPAFLAMDHPDERVASALPAALIVRPEQLGRTIEALTGHVWIYDLDRDTCAESLFNPCWGSVEATRADRWGFRSMTGGIDGWEVTAPSHAVTPTRLLFMGALAEEASASVVASDFSVPVENRRLLRAIEPSVVDEEAVRAQLVGLHRSVLSEEVGSASPEVDESYALFLAGSDPETGWRLVLAGMLQSERILFY